MLSESVQTSPNWQYASPYIKKKLTKKIALQVRLEREVYVLRVLVDVAQLAVGLAILGVHAYGLKTHVFRFLEPVYTLNY